MKIMQLGYIYWAQFCAHWNVRIAWFIRNIKSILLYLPVSLEFPCLLRVLIWQAVKCPAALLGDLSKDWYADFIFFYISETSVGLLTSHKSGYAHEKKRNHHYAWLISEADVPSQEQILWFFFGIRGIILQNEISPKFTLQ